MMFFFLEKSLLKLLYLFSRMLDTYNINNGDFLAFVCFFCVIFFWLYLLIYYIIDHTISFINKKRNGEIRNKKKN